MAINEFKWTPEEIKTAQETYFNEAQAIHDAAFGPFTWNSEAVTAALKAVTKNLHRTPRLTHKQEKTVQRILQYASDEEQELIDIIRATTEPCLDIEDLLAEILPCIPFAHRAFVNDKLKEVVQLAKENKL